MIIRIEKTKDYSVMSNIALTDPALSLKAKGLWAFLMTKPDSWNINYRGLQEQLKEGQASILSALKELEATGYLVRGRVREDDGTFSQMDATLYEQPCVGNPCVGNSRVDSSRTKVNTEQVNTEKDTASVDENSTEPFSFDEGSQSALPGRAAPPERNETKRLFYEVVKKYRLTVINHNNVRRWVKSLDESLTPATAQLYLTRLLQRNLNEEALTGEFVPQITTVHDIVMKSGKIIQYFKRTKGALSIASRSDDDYYRRNEEKARKIRGEA